MRYRSNNICADEQTNERGLTAGNRNNAFVETVGCTKTLRRLRNFTIRYDKMRDDIIFTCAEKLMNS